MKANSFAQDSRANLNFLPIVFTIVGAVVVLSLVAALAPTFFTAVGDTVTALTDAETNNTVANTILGVMTIVVALVLALGFIALILRATKIGGGSKF